MADNWKPGDLALCVKGGRVAGTTDPSRPPLRDYPKQGKIYTVSGVRSAIFVKTGSDLGLILEDAPLNRCGIPVWHHARFIKLPEHEEDDFDREIIELYQNKEVPEHV